MPSRTPFDVVRRRFVIERYHLNRRVGDSAEEPVQRGAVEEHLQTRPRALAEDDVGDPFPPCERDQPLGRPFGMHPYDGAAEALRKPDVFRQGLRVVRIDATWLLPGRLDVHGVPS